MAPDSSRRTYDLGQEWEATFETRVEGKGMGRKMVETLELRNVAKGELIVLGGDSLLRLRKIFKGVGK